MCYEGKRFLKLGVVIVTAAVLMGPAIAVAQRGSSPGGVTGEGRLHPGTWNNQRTSRSVRHARDYARDVYRYSRDADSVDPAVAKEESEEMGRNIAKAQKELATARKEAGNNAQTLAALKSIEQHLATAASQHKMLHEECCTKNAARTPLTEACV